MADMVAEAFTNEFGWFESPSPDHLLTGGRQMVKPR
jgi:hypothetical protein